MLKLKSYFQIILGSFLGEIYVYLDDTLSIGYYVEFPCLNLVDKLYNIHVILRNLDKIQVLRILGKQVFTARY